MIMVVGAEAVHSQQTSDAYPRMVDHIFLDVAKVSGQRGALFCHCKIDQSVVVDISATFAFLQEYKHPLLVVIYISVFSTIWLRLRS